jgi:ligand-binding SRPBCC domain-containing protein
MKTYLLEREQWIGQPLPRVFGFFARPENLGRITPPWMDFRMLTPLPIDMCAGARIDYTIRLAAVPMRWRTLIATWEPERRFVDVQERGPYTLWEHTHAFTAHEGGVLIADHVRYALPLGRLGRIAHTLAVRATLAAIFDYRFRRVRELLGEEEAGDERQRDPAGTRSPRTRQLAEAERREQKARVAPEAPNG